MKSAGKARSNGLYRHIRTSKEIIRNLLNYLCNTFSIGHSNRSRRLFLAITVIVKMKTASFGSHGGECVSAFVLKF